MLALTDWLGPWRQHLKGWRMFYSESLQFSPISLRTFWAVNREVRVPVTKTRRRSFYQKKWKISNWLTCSRMRSCFTGGGSIIDKCSKYCRKDARAGSWSSMTSCRKPRSWQQMKVSNYHKRLTKQLISFSILWVECFSDTNSIRIFSDILRAWGGCKAQARSKNRSTDY